MLNDPAAERAVLAGCFAYGVDGYIEVADIITDKSFKYDLNKISWQIIDTFFKQNQDAKHLDLASFLSTAKSIGLDHLINQSEASKHLRSVMNLQVHQDNLRKNAAVVRKLEIAGQLINQLDCAKEEILDITGKEPIYQILGIAENKILDFSNLLNTGDEEPHQVGKYLDQYLQNIRDNPNKSIGVPTPFPIFNETIGGGMRKGTVSLIGTRTKAGKTMTADNTAIHVAMNVGIPTLLLDTEMTIEEHYPRLLAMLSKIKTRDIEKGLYLGSKDKEKKVDGAADLLKNLPFTYKSVVGVEFEEIIAIIRRWIARKVGFNSDGTAKDCLIIFDYMKLANSSELHQNMAEYQKLGFLMAALHNFAVKYKVPIMSFVQLNREKEIASSDRQLWSVSNFSILAIKDKDAQGDTHPKFGNRMLTPIYLRHGQPLDDGDYINMMLYGEIAYLKEGFTRNQIASGQTDQKFEDFSDVPEQHI